MGQTTTESGDSSIAMGKLKKKDAKSKCSDYEKSMKAQMDAAIAFLTAAGDTASGSVSCDVK
jgi:hypothetical protein